MENSPLHSKQNIGKVWNKQGHRHKIKACGSKLVATTFIYEYNVKSTR
jgi:hypothetical protein